MHRNNAWLCFLGIVLLCVIGFTGKTLLQMYQYYSLTKQTAIDSIDWSVNEVHSDRYFLEANYTYSVDSSSYPGHTSFPKPAFLNEWAAKQKIAEFSSHAWKVWYSSGHPDKSSLQKSFPLKESISVVVLWSLFLYFMWLGVYVAKKHT